MEMNVPDDKPSEFVCAWVPSSLVDICSRTDPNAPLSARDAQYAKGYFPNLHSLPVPPYPEDLRGGAQLWSEDPAQYYFPFYYTIRIPLRLTSKSRAITLNI